MTESNPIHTQPYAAAELPATGSYDPSGAAAKLVALLDQYLADLQAGRAPDRERLRAEHPELAAELDQCLSGIDFVHRAAQSAATPVQLGDFRIVREIGRGGMGVVYEAEQLSLRRRVALKVLRFAGVADPEAMQRFQREAETVARLHHTNVVPIFAIGCEQGVHYYAMQYIEGRSLAAVIEEARDGLDAHLIARLGLQAAEALAHAHQRGVIHRDVKPSNLILDPEGGLWLTDFGLARRRDEVTLTVTGVLMGTPRYMSPEQAVATNQPIDHRTDVYSLGATLYELATGKPVFDGTTPQGVITQIINAEPVAPGLVKSGLPRDLETIILKCLAKEPARRYQTAQALADDLRAFLEGRPIQAHRPSLAERAVHWARKHRRSVTLMAGAAAAAVLLMAGGLLGLEQYRRWQIGTVMLSNAGPVLTGEVLDETGRQVLPRFTVPTEEPLALTAGSYQLRLRGRGFLDETYQLRIERGQELAFAASLKDQSLWEPVQVERAYECLRFGDRHDILALARSGVSRLHGGTGAVLWTSKLGAKDHPHLADFRWDWDARGWPSGRGDFDRRPRLLQPGPDLDGDGVPDLVWASRRQATVLALAGKTGQVLWCFQAPPKLPLDSQFQRESASTGIALGVAVLPDVNGGIPDLVVTFASQQQTDKSVPRWIEAISGRTGKSLWQYHLDSGWFTAPPGNAVPHDATWVNTQGIIFAGGNGHQSGINMLYEKDWLHTSGGLPVPYPAEVVKVAGQLQVVLVAGTHLVGLDPVSGKPLWPAVELGFWPLRAPQFADLDGDHSTDMLLLGPGEVEAAPEKEADPRAVDPPDLPALFPPGLVPEVKTNARTDDRLKLTALALATRKRLWETPFRGYWGWTWFQEPFTWPVVQDLDSDGKPEVIVPTGDFEGQTKWSGVQVCDGATGAVRWLRKLSRSSRFGQVQQVNRILVGPAGLPAHAGVRDGFRPIFTAVLDGEFWRRDRPYSSIQVGNLDKDYNNPVLLVDALSGKDGHGLWWARQHLPSGALTTTPKPSVGPLLWWHAEHAGLTGLHAGLTGLPGRPGRPVVGRQDRQDGWPQLVVPYVPGSPQQHQSNPVSFMSSRTGQVLHVADYRELRTLDLDGDGTLDLLSFRPTMSDAYDQGGKLETTRGRSPETWRRLGGAWQLAGDLDGDGIPDLVTTQAEDRVGRESKKAERENIADPEVLARRERAKRGQGESKAISGRDGRALWQREIQDAQRHTPWEPTLFTQPHPILPGTDLDGDGVPDLLVTGKRNTTNFRHEPFSPLLAVSGRTGQRLWAADIAVEIWTGPQFLQCHDLDVDGQKEVLFISAMDWGWERQTQGNHTSDEWQYWLAVLSGRDGKVRWKQPLGERDHPGLAPTTTPFACTLADLNGDGALDVIVEAIEPNGDGGVRCFSGKDGTLLWRWAPEPRRGSQASRPTLAVGDLDGDGRAEVVVLHRLDVRDAQGRLETHAEVLALDGATGRSKWSWREPVNYEYNDTSNGAIRSRVTPLLVNLEGGKRRAVCVWTYHYTTRGQIVLLDAEGKEIQRQRVQFRLNGDGWQRFHDDPKETYAPYYSSLFRVWAVDLDGDGTDELVYFSRDKLRVLRGGLEQVLCEWPLPEEDCDLLEVSPKTERHPLLLAVRAGGRVVFLGTAPEKPYWTCTGSGKPLAVAWEPSGPRVIYDLGNEVTVCRIAQSSSAGEPGGPQLVLPSSGDDPRFVVSLPWYPLGDLPPLLPSSSLGLAAALLGLAVAVLLAPALLLHGAIRRRAWLLCLAPVLWLGLVWGGAWLLFLARLENEAKWQIYTQGEWGFAWRLGWGLLQLALAGLPMAAFVISAVRWSRERRWGRLLLLLASVPVLAVLVGLVWLFVLTAGPGDERHYSWRGWYALWPAGVYVAGLLLLAGFLVIGAARLGRARVRRLLRRAVP